MESSDITQRLTRFVHEELIGSGDGVQLAEEDDLLLSGHVDSMGIMRLVEHLETEHSLAVPPEDVTIDNFSSIASLTRYIATHGEGKSQ